MAELSTSGFEAFRSIARGTGSPVPGASQTISTSGAAASNTVDLPLNGHVLLVAETVGCFIRESKDGTANAVVDVDMYIPPNVPMLVLMGSDGTSGGNFRRISAITSAGSGKLHITPMHGG